MKGRHPFERGDVELLLALADSGNLARAAQALGVHHATAFRRLADTESKAGALLFDRLPSGYALTEAGRLLVEPARRLREQMLEFDARVLNFDRALNGRIRVTASDGLASGYLAPHLAAFSRAHPDIELDLRVENRTLDIAAREIDVAIRPAKKLSGGMVGRSAGRVGYALYAAPAYARARGAVDPVAPDLRGHDLILYAESLGFYTTAAWLERQARRARVVARANNMAAMLALAQAGAGVAVLPCALGDGVAGVTRLAPPLEVMATQLWLCTHPDIRKVARIRALLDALHASISTDRARLAGEP